MKGNEKMVMAVIIKRMLIVTMMLVERLEMINDIRDIDEEDAIKSTIIVM
jgi:hypothetical protein